MTERRFTDKPELAKPAIMSRAAAMSAGLKHYFTGTPCPHGHISRRRVSNGNCMRCNADAMKRLATEKPDLLRERYRRWREKYPEGLAKAKAAWSRRNRDKVNARRKRWGITFPEKVKELRDHWNAANPERLKANWRNRKARVKAALGRHTAEDVKNILRLQKGRCAYCRCRLSGEYHVDHIVALSRGGTNDRSNLQALCAACNLSKHARDPIEFAQSLGRLI